jgi:hypothetical protein
MILIAVVLTVAVLVTRDIMFPEGRFADDD